MCNLVQEKKWHDVLSSTVIRYSVSKFTTIGWQHVTIPMQNDRHIGSTVLFHLVASHQVSPSGYR